MADLKTVLSPQSLQPQMTKIAPAEVRASINEKLEDVEPRYEKSWLFVPHLLKLNLLILVPLSASCLNGFDGGILNGFQSMETWTSYMGNPAGAILGALVCALPFGLLLSIWVAHYISDKFGRKTAIYVAAVCTLIGIIIQTCAVNYASFLVSRLIIGCGIGFYMISAPALITEIAYPKHRPICVSFYNTTWYLGSVVAIWVTYGTHFMGSTQWSWRIPALVQCIFPILHIVFLRFVPESPRYLIAVGKKTEAEEILCKYHGGGNMEVAGALVAFEMNEIEAAVAGQKQAKDVPFSQFFKTKGNLLRLFICVFMGYLQMCTGIGVIAVYMNIVLETVGITSENEKLIITACLSIFNMVIACCSSFLTSYFRRRTIFLSSLGSLLVFYVIWTILSALTVESNFTNKALSRSVLGFTFISYAAYNVGFMGLPFVYLTEILPFSLRSKGLLIYTLAEELFLLYNGFVNPVAMDCIQWKYYIVFCVSIAVCFVLCYMFFPETRGYSLEEVGLLFGDEIDFNADVQSLSGEEPLENIILTPAKSSEKQHV